MFFNINYFHPKPVSNFKAFGHLSPKINKYNKVHFFSKYYIFLSVTTVYIEYY
jgi:hypothetical protein